jgi:hypothetical protein
MKKPNLLFILLINILLFAGCNRNSNSSADLLIQFRKYLDNLPKSELASISHASNEFRKSFPSASPEIRDMAFVEFRSFYYNVINHYYEIFGNNQELINKLNDNKNDDPRVRNLKLTLDQNGLRLSKTEGGYYIDEKPDYLYNNFKNFVSNDINEFLLIRSKELEEGFSEDAKLLISFKALGDRITIWEKYLNKYPASPLAAEAKFSYHLYLNTFLTGLDNSPVTKDNVFLPEMKNVYSDYIQKNYNSESGKIVEKFFSIISKNNFRLTSSLDDFYDENQIESMKGIEAPTR